MPRVARIVVENVAYHITQRGNARQQVFFDPSDYRLYLTLLRAYAGDARLHLTAYCLMPNHVHLIAVPERPDSMASALGRTHANFARFFNLKRITCGHVWQARYFSCPLDQPHLSKAIAYVERNPVRAGLVEQRSSMNGPARASMAAPWTSIPTSYRSAADSRNQAAADVRSAAKNSCETSSPGQAERCDRCLQDAPGNPAVMMKASFRWRLVFECTVPGLNPGQYTQIPFPSSSDCYLNPLSFKNPSATAPTPR